MNALDAVIIRNIRREFGKRPIEATRVDIQVVTGRVTMTGVITNLRDQPNVDLEMEMAAIMKMITRDRLVKEVTSNIRLISNDDAKKEETNTRGRMRHH